MFTTIESILTTVPSIQASPIGYSYNPIQYDHQGSVGLRSMVFPTQIKKKIYELLDSYFEFKETKHGRTRIH